MVLQFKSFVIIRISKFVKVLEAYVQRIMACT
jgi:hypothetical protein